MHYLILPVIVYSIQNMTTNKRKKKKFRFTLLTLDVFFDETDVHFSSSSLFFGRLGVVTLSTGSTVVGGDVLLTFSDSDVRSLNLQK